MDSPGGGVNDLDRLRGRLLVPLVSGGELSTT
jgi:hypothetical protein